jgi:anti-anti-sigma factor
MTAHPRLITDGSHAVLKVTASLDWQSYAEFSRIFDQIQAKLSNLTVDLTALDHIDNAGLGMLLLLRQRAAAHQVAVKLRAPANMVSDIVALSRFDTLFDIETADFPADGGQKGGETEIMELSI